MRPIILPLALALLLLAGAASRARAAEPKWGAKPYSRNAQDEPLRALLLDFAGANGFKAVVSGRISERVSGRFESQDPRRFIETIAKAYGITWYYDGSRLFFYRGGEIRSRVIALQFASVGRLVASLKELGIWDDRYPVRAGQTEDAALVTGPPRHVELVLETARRLEGKEIVSAPTFSDGQVVKVFPLRNAWAADVTFNQGGSQVTVPGVASLLNSLINKDPSPNRQSLDPRASAALRGLSQKDDMDPGELFSLLQGQPGQAQGNGRNRTAIFADARTNSVVIKDTRENLQRYQGLVNTLDAPVGLVELSAAIIDVSVNDVRELGVEWQQMNQGQYHGHDVQYKHGMTLSNLAGTAQPNDPIQGPASMLRGYTFTTLAGTTGRNLLARIRMLEDRGKARVNERPVVLTFDNLRASISQTQVFHVRVSGEREAELFRLETGTHLRVTPHIVENEGQKSIRLVVEIEDGSAAPGQVDNIPIIGNSVINTQALVQDEESLLLGGFIRTEESFSHSGIPFLSRIPLLGALFRGSSRVSRKVERIFMITPRIIQDPSEAGNLFEFDTEERDFQKQKGTGKDG